MFNKKLKIDYSLLIIIIIGLVFFFIYSFLALNFPHNFSGEPKLILNSPDETANYFYSDLFARKTTLKFQDDANLIADGLVVPRSMRVINDYTVPAGFIGLPLIYGSLAKVLGSCSIQFFTPLFAILGIIFFYLLIKELFGKTAGFLSALFVFILPAFWYYTNRSMMPNILFIVLIIIALYFWLKALRHKKILYYLFFGFSTGLALMVRTSDVVWFLPLFFILLLLHLKKIKWLYLFFSVVIGVITFIPVLFFNKANYGQYFSFGYDTGLFSSTQNQLFALAGKIVLPFGFHPVVAFKNLLNYTWGIFPFWTILGVAFILIFILWSVVKKQKVFIVYWILYLLVSAYLVIYYGSWSFHDNPNPDLITIGTSYIRYWLPIYLFLLPMIFIPLVDLLKKRKITLGITVTALWLFFAFLSFQLVIMDNQEGIYKISKNIKEYQNIAGQVQTKTENNAIIIADRLDKVFFPKRKVIFRLNNNLNFLAVKKLIVAGYPVYYFYFTRSSEDLTYFNEKYFKKFDLEVNPSILGFKEQSLYPIKLTEETNNGI
ncbi:glycosyltransferase family 39 protein [Patescibacteria group bacterium]|nr:glycosyltransferase family 39 protein [Patescibacteria group bacterium]